MEWQDYEVLVKDIYAELSKKDNVTIECYGSDCKRPGNSTVNHQLDVLVSNSDGIHTFFTAIECKYWNRKVNKNIVMKLSAICEDCNFHKGVIVSQKGFTPDAETYAGFKEIDLIELRKPTDEDFENRVSKINLSLQPLIPQIIDFTVTPAVTLNLNIDGESSYLQFSNGTTQKIADVLYQFFSSLKNAQKYDQNVTKNMPYPSNTYLIPDRDEKHKFIVNEINLTGRLNRANPDTITFDAKDYVWMILKLLFKDKLYTIDHDGKIRAV